MIKKIIVGIYALVILTFTIFLTPVKQFGFSDGSFLHVTNKFRSMLIEWHKATDESLIRYDIDMQRLLVIWFVITIVFGAIFYISNKRVPKKNDN